eukprot:4471895-Pyramimonas_sp.AAC.1
MLFITPLIKEDSLRPSISATSAVRTSPDLGCNFVLLPLTRSDMRKSEIMSVGRMLRLESNKSLIAAAKGYLQ